MSLLNRNIQMSNEIPIVIYQMGKVGSQTIWKSLQGMNLHNPIYHIHVLNSKNIDKSIEILKSKGSPITLQLQQAQELIAYLEKCEYPEMKIVTVVREPLAQLLSSLFQRMKVHTPQLTDSDGSWKVDEIAEHTYNLVRAKKINAFHWFKREFKEGLGIDVYEYPFDRLQGYSRISKNGLDILILRLESSENWEHYLTEFFNFPVPFKILNQNRSEEKTYKTAYHQVKSSLKFPHEILEEIYSSPYCQHFYTEEMNEGFIDRWKLAE
ncbi:MAG: putative capsular polysaccharide synthesis family protein [Cyanobacteriota bacterium]|nr:putative capsular polysaccharide synthesis family protein [Cyanobacteriota bacterium]